MKLYQLTLLLIYISISIVPIKNIIKNKIFKFDHEELTPYSNWWCITHSVLLIIVFICLIAKLTEYLFTKIDCNLIVF